MTETSSTRQLVSREGIRPSIPGSRTRSLIGVSYHTVFRLLKRQENYAPFPQINTNQLQKPKSLDF